MKNLTNTVKMRGFLIVCAALLLSIIVVYALLQK
jgi:hypothetical protein